MADLAGFRVYALARGNNSPTEATDSAAEAALVRGGDYIADEYVANFLPAYADPLPEAVDDAIYEAAIIELASPGALSKTYTEGADKALVAVEGIKWEFTGRKGGSQVPKSTKIEAKLRPYMGGATKTLLRA